MPEKLILSLVSFQFVLAQKTKFFLSPLSLCYSLKNGFPISQKQFENMY